MGFSDWLSGDGDGQDGAPDKYQVVARKHDGQAAPMPEEVESGGWVYEGDPPTKEQFRFEYGEYLNPRFKYVCVPNDRGTPVFDDVQWSISPEREAGEEMPPWAQDLAARIDEQSSQPSGDLEEQLIRAIAETEGPSAALEEAKQMKLLENGEGAGATLAESVQDPTDPREIAGRGLLQMTEGYQTVGDMMEDVMGGALGAATPDVGPGASGQQQAGQPDRPAVGGAGATPPPRDPTPDDTERSSSLRDQFGSEPTTDTVDARPEQEIPDPQTPGQLWDETTYSHNDIQTLASRHGYPDTPVGKRGDELRGWLEDELFETAADEAEQPDDYGDPEDLEAGPEDAPDPVVVDEGHGGQDGHVEATGADVTAGAPPDVDDSEDVEDGAPIEATAPQGGDAA